MRMPDSGRMEISSRNTTWDISAAVHDDDSCASKKPKLELKSSADQGDAEPKKGPEEPQPKRLPLSQPKSLTISRKSKNAERHVHVSPEPEIHADDARNFANQLYVMLSNIYLDAPQRLGMTYLPRCARDLAHCHKAHYRIPMPEAPSRSQACNLHNALQNGRYHTFVNLATNMCLRNEFPGDGVIAKIVELILSINTERDSSVRISDGLRRVMGLSYLLVHQFPPCWRTLRPFYLRFFKNGFDKTKIATKQSHKFSDSEDVLGIVLDLLEHTLRYYGNNLDISQFSSSQNSERISIVNRSLLEFNSQNFYAFEFEQKDTRVNTFAAMTPTLRLERIFSVLRLILQILEYDFVMWIWHHHKKGRDWIFASDDAPLSIVIMEMSLTVRLSSVTRRVLSIFSKMVQKGIQREYLCVMERFIRLIMLASNIADIEVTDSGIEFPYLGSDTEILISDFYNIFKEENTTSIENYIQAANILRLPFVRYEFIHNFLQSFGLSSVGEFCPHKVLMDIVRKRWQTFLPASKRGTGDNNNNKNLENDDDSDDEFINRAHRSATDDDELTREQYLNLLLEGLKSYCDWYGLRDILRFITLNERMRPLKIITDSIHRLPTRGSADDVILLKKMAQDIRQLERNVRMDARITPPRVILPQAEVVVGPPILQRYRSDLKYCFLTSSEIAKQTRLYTSVNFSEWIEFLKVFQPADH